MKQKDLMLLLIPSFIMVAAWVIFNIYHSSVSSTISENLNMQISPINPSFDLKEVDAIKKRNSVNPLYELQAQPSATPLPQVATSTPTIVPAPTASPSGSISSASGGLR